MKLYFYNTLSRKIELFRPIKKELVGLYTCGPTVYNYAHLGNLRTYVFEDVLQRVLEYGGYKVKRVMNITDVGHLTSDADTGEDKLERGARLEKKTVWDIAKFYTQAFFKDTTKLNIKKPRLIAPATKFIKEQIALISQIMKRGLAYETPTAVYFNVAKFPSYTKLSQQKLSEKRVAAREEVVVDQGKKNAADFVLWFKLIGKFKNHIMRWRSPWGEGFPGWHIECSAIASSLLGQPFDIHTGGVDLRDVHHTNEIAQSEGAYKKPLARYWMHGEFLVINEKRMGKSEGNLMTVSEIERRSIPPLAFRYFVLTSHYRSQLNLSWEALTASKNAYEKLIGNVRALETFLASRSRTKKTTHTVPLVQKFEKEFENAISSDLDTPHALAAVHTFLRSLATLRSQGLLTRSGAHQAYRAIVKADEVLGLSLKGAVKIPTKVQSLLRQRELFRASKQFMQSDTLRKQIYELGYMVDDTPVGPFVRPRES